MPSPLERLEAALLSIGRPLAIAFSGGSDSRLLCFFAQRLGLKPLCLHLEGPHVLPCETEDACAFAKAHGLAFERIFFNPLAAEGVASGGRSRCYACKKAMVSLMERRLAETGEAERRLCDGSNLDDLSAFRPGLAALREKGVLSPLALARCTKKDVLLASASLGLTPPPLGSRPCLLTRFPYGKSPDARSLEALAGAESKLALLFGRGDFRVRLLDEGPALQTGFALEGEARDAATSVLESCGLAPSTFLCGGPVSGYFDKKG